MHVKKLVVALGLACLLPTAHASDAIFGYSYTYDDHSRVKTIDGPRVDVEDITTFEYEKANLTKVTNALGHVTERKDFDDYFGKPQTQVRPTSSATLAQHSPVGASA